MQWTEGCVCNSGKPGFDAIEFIADNLRISIVSGKCLGTICWWPIIAEQIVQVAAHGTKKSLAIPARTTDINIRRVS